MSWDDIDDIIYDGTDEQVKSVRCPECDSGLRLAYYPKTRSVEIRCNECGVVIRQNGVTQTPNFASLQTVS